MKMGPVNLSFALAGEQKGTMELDEGTGWVEKTELRMEAEGKVTIAGSPQMPEGLTLPMSIKNITHIESRPVTPKAK